MGEDQCTGPGPAPVQVRVPQTPLSLVLPGGGGVLDTFVQARPEAQKSLLRGSGLRGRRDFARHK